jgi:hypothetical protein
MATSEEELERRLAGETLELPPMTVTGAWHPGSDREPTLEELQAYSDSVAAEAPAPTDVPEPAEADVVQRFRRGEPEPAPWTPESGREPTLAELEAFSPIAEPPAPPPPPPVRLTPEEQLRAAPGMQPEYIPPTEAPEIEPEAEPVVALPTYPPVDEEIPPWTPESGVEPTPEQLRQYSGIEPGANLQPKTPRDTVSVNPINLPVKEYDDVGRLRTALGNFTQSAGRLISGVPKAVQLWFAPDVDFLEWMDEMDRIDQRIGGTTSKAALEIYRKERIDHIVRGQQKFGTTVNVFTADMLNGYVETKDLTGDELLASRKRVREKYLEAMQKTVDRPLYRVGEIFDEVVRDTFPANPEYQDEWLTGIIPSGLGSVTGYLAVFATTRRPTAAIVQRAGVAPTGIAAKGIQGAVTAGVGVTTQQSFAFEAALREGATIEDAMRATYSGFTYLAGASEAIPIANFFDRADKASGGAIKRAIMRMFVQGGEEFAQESFQSIMENLTAQGLYDPERQLWTGVGEAGAAGFTTGAIVEFLASLIPGRRRAAAQRGADRDEASLADQLEAARQGAEEAGGDELDQAESMSELLAQLAEGEAEWQRGLKARLQARQEAREERPGDRRPLAVLAEAEAAIERLPFEQQAEVAALALAEGVAEAKEAAFERAEAEAAEVREEEVREAEYEREIEIGEERERVAEAVEAQEVEPARIEEVVEPEVRAGLEEMRAARAERELVEFRDRAREDFEKYGVSDRERDSVVRALRENVSEEAAAAYAETYDALTEEAVTARQAQKALPAPPIRVTPEGEALLPAEAAEREEVLAAEREARVAAAPVGKIERPFVVDETGREVQAPEVAVRGAQLTEQLELPVDEVTAAAQEAATSPTNDQVVTRKQLESGNYKKGRLTPNQTAIPGVDVAIESPAGSVRTGRDWTQDMYDHYGYISRTESAEGPDEQLDVFVNPKIMEQPYDTVFVVDQVNDDGSFDEHKVMMGYQNQMEAVRAYKKNNPRGRKVGTITPMSKIEFRGWLETGDQTRPVAPQPTAPEVLAGEEEFREIAARRRRGRGRRREREPVVRFRAGEEPTPIAEPYSRMREALAKKLPGKMPVAQLPQLIKNLVAKGDFRAEEATFFDLEEAVAWMEGEGTITREAVLDLMDFMRPAIEEQILQIGEENEFDTETEAMAAVEDKYGPLKTRTSPSGAITTLFNEEGKLVATVYGPVSFDEATEVVPEVPGEAVTLRTNYLVIFHAIDQTTVARHMGYQAVDGGENYREILITLPRQAGRFESRFRHEHYPHHDNVLAFARVAIFEDEQGRKVFMILEAQSDWHQTGRKHGYQSAVARKEKEEELRRDGLFPQEDEEWLLAVIGGPKEGAPVDYAPYEKSWPLMLMRRMINHAVAEGADVVAWPRGETIAEMYDERMEVDEISFDPEHNSLMVTDTSGEMTHTETVELENVENILGKELGDRVKKLTKERQTLRESYSMSEEYDEDAEGYPVLDPDGNVVTDWAGAPFVVMHPEHVKDVFMFKEGLPGSDPVSLKGTALKMGGEALISFYNNELKQKTNKWVKRFGSKVQDINVMEFGTPVTAHGFEVTTDMQAEAMVRGFPYFREGEEEIAPIKEVQVKDAKAAVKPLTDELIRVKPTILAKASDAPAEVYAAMRQRGMLRAKGVYWQGKLYIFANNHSDVRDVVKTMLHEGVAHMGLRALYQNEAELNDMLDGVFASLTEEQIASLRGRAKAYEAIDLDTPAGRRELAEEHIAHLAETDPNHSFIKRIVAKLKQMFRAAGIEMEWTHDDIVNLLKDARRELREMVPLERITVTTDVGDRRADIALRQHDKRIGVVETLRECL